jgi:pyrroline-5-carboxylate reductase
VRLFGGVGDPSAGRSGGGSGARAQLNGSTTVVSLIAGVTLEKLASCLATTPMARVIPNTLTDTGFGYSGVTLNAHTSEAEIEPFLHGFGKVVYLPERLIDIFTGFAVEALIIFTTLSSSLPMPAYWRRSGV